MRRTGSSPETITPDDAWQILVDAGLPLGPAHARLHAPGERELAAAVDLVMRCPPSLPEAEPLHAMLRAWRDHFPASFERALGPRGARFLRRLAWAGEDRDRFLKLRRLALAHLSRML